MAIMAAGGHGPYNSSKSAYEAYSDILRLEVEHHEVSVSVIQPAIVKSAIHNKWGVDDDQLKLYKEVYPHVYLPGKMERRARYIRKASPTIVSSSAIYKSITDAYPHTR